MKPIDLIIFDLDGTLVNTLEDIAASVNYTLQKLGRPLIPIDSVRQYVGDGVEMLMRRALSGSDEFLPDAVGIYKVHHSRNLLVRSRLYPSVTEVLEHFRNLPMAVLSNKTSEFVQPLLDGLKISGYFRVVLGAGSGLPLKPAPDAVQKIMAEFEASKDRTVIVGDGTADVRAGKAAGVITCSVTYGFRSEEELRKAGPDYIIHELSELKGLFTPMIR
ncbi:MAG TPA: HAD-IA family hydrolase [Nitrospirota bacterium]|nr:HAD-IA family hydrolase [Nitrospirota bacterium]